MTTLHTLKNTPGARHRRMRVGRGEASGKGKTSGRGHKGQMSRSGHNRRPAFEGGQMPLIRRIPKRGFHHAAERILLPVNVGSLSRFEGGGEVTLEHLRKIGLVKGRCNGIKILGDGDLNRNLRIKAQAFSASARAKIEAAGGTCEVVA